MNKPVLRLYVLVVVLFGVLVAFTSRWTVFEATALRDNDLNKRELLQEQKIKRGVIRAAGGQVLARSVRRRGGIFTRRYPTDALFAHAVGYSFTTIGRAGLERSRNDELTGRRTELVTAFESILGRSERGRRRAHVAGRQGPAGRAARRCRRPTTRARSWRSTSRPAACSRWRPRRATTRTAWTTRPASPSSTATTPTRRSSTARRRTATRRARR